MEDLASPLSVSRYVLSYGAKTVVFLAPQHCQPPLNSRSSQSNTTDASVSPLRADRADRNVEAALRRFFYLPFAHSESLADQDRSLALVNRLGEPDLSRARRHRDIIWRFGRFPHRNPILGRSMTTEEQCFLDEGGYSG